jgi:hypothetical protein
MSMGLSRPGKRACVKTDEHPTFNVQHPTSNKDLHRFDDVIWGE